MHIIEQLHPYWKEMTGFSKILFPTDFSKTANHALENALCLSGVREVIVQHVVSTYFEKHPHWATLFDIHEMQKFMDMYVESEMSKVAGQAQSGVSYRSVISQGRPALQIVELADKEKVDLIVMGPARGGSPVRLFARQAGRYLQFRRVRANSSRCRIFRKYLLRRTALHIPRPLSITLLR